VVNGTWGDGTTTDVSETVADGASPEGVPTGMVADPGFTGGTWGVDPASAIITADATFTYTFEEESVAPPEPTTDPDATASGDEAEPKPTDTAIPSPAPAPPLPSTGDNSHVGFWTTLMALSAMGLFGMALAIRNSGDMRRQ
jgi:hypothetical protein